MYPYPILRKLGLGDDERLVFSPERRDYGRNAGLHVSGDRALRGSVEAQL